MADYVPEGHRIVTHDLGSQSRRLWLSRAAVSAILPGWADPAGAEAHGVWLGEYFRAAEARTASSLDEALGLGPRPLVRGTTDFVLTQAAEESTLEGAMRRTALAYNRIHGGDYNRVRRMNGLLIYIIDDARFPYSDMPPPAVTLMLECVLIHLHSCFCALTHSDLTPAVVHVATRRAFTNVEDAMGVWPCGARWGRPWFALAYDEGIGCTPVLTAGPRPSAAIVHARLMHLVERREAELSRQSDLPSRVRAVLRSDLVCDQAEAARRLGCSPATLRRQLTAEGLAFRRLRDEVLNERARLELLGLHPIADIAEILGYADSRSFARAFKRWNGVAPNGFRRSPSEVSLHA
ncbi:MAG TPA: helix-turn-helix domain-containing protein [Brevundimonas sp.]